MSDSRRSSGDRSLFDLPLEMPAPRRTVSPPESETSEAEPKAAESAELSTERATFPLFPDHEASARRGRGTFDALPRVSPLATAPELAPPTAPPEPTEEHGAELAREPRPASLPRRWVSGGADLALHAVLGLGLIGGTRLLGARVEADEIYALGLFLAIFSFLYSVIPLAFWGRTPGMWQARVIACGEGHGALTFGQTALRWLGSLLTVALAGLPSLLALVGGRSLTDRLSGTATYEQ